MRITGIELFHIVIPFAKPYHLSKAYGTLHDAHAVVFKLHTNEGIVGLGEANPMNPFTEETPGTVMSVTREMIAPLILGCDPSRIPATERTLDQSIQGHPTARGAINMAFMTFSERLYECRRMRCWEAFTMRSCPFYGESEAEHRKRTWPRSMKSGSGVAGQS